MGDPGPGEVPGRPPRPHSPPPPPPPRGPPAAAPWPWRRRSGPADGTGPRSQRARLGASPLRPLCPPRFRPSAQPVAARPAPRRTGEPASEVRAGAGPRGPWTRTPQPTTPFTPELTWVGLQVTDKGALRAAVPAVPWVLRSPLPGEAASLPGGRPPPPRTYYVLVGTGPPRGVLGSTPSRA